MFHQRKTWLAALLIFTVGGCDWLWPLEGDYDPYRCEPSCAAGTRCHGGQCVKDGDGSIPDKTKKQPKQDGLIIKKDKKKVPKDVVSPDKVPWPVKKDTGPPCKTGKKECTTATSIRICENSKWQYSDCTAYCKSKGDDYSNGCSKHPFTGTAGCNCHKYQPYGGTCYKTTKKCVSGHICGYISSAYVYGFCTRLCKTDADCTGVPAGTMALCNLTNTSSQKMCGFVCSIGGHTCPKGLVCLTIKKSCRPPAPI